MRWVREIQPVYKGLQILYSTMCMEQESDFFFCKEARQLLTHTSGGTSNEHDGC
jgi:hypothetical protein